MIYLSESNIRELNLDWTENIQVIEEAVGCIDKNDHVQPVKPYLRFRNLTNRIIAMPAFIGGDFNIAGIKWIASFPDNIQKGIARAHSVVILNEANTGVPVAILNSSSISAIRTASVSGLMIKRFIENKDLKEVKLGIIGFGPIGQHHLNMCNEVLNGRISRVFLYDINKVNIEIVPDALKDKVVVTDSWESAYSDADIFITCTVSRERYINVKPKPGSLHLNVSLRDYTDDVFQWFSGAIVVDDWEEICRENTDIEMFHKMKGLQKEDVRLIQDVVFSQYFQSLGTEQAILFNPMGMAIFDIAMSKYYTKKAEDNKVGQFLV